MIFNSLKEHIICLHSTKDDFVKKVLAVLQATKKSYVTIDIQKTMPTNTQWHYITTHLGCKLSDLMKSSFLEDLGNETYSEEGFMKIFDKNPQALEGVIIVEGDNIEHIKEYTKILKFFNVDSAGLNKTFYTEEPLLSRSTQKDRFIP